MYINAIKTTFMLF